MKSYGDESTDFHDKGILKASPNCTCVAVILIGFVSKRDENYYLQVYF